MKQQQATCIDLPEIPDFLLIETLYEGGQPTTSLELRRFDLAQLRQCFGAMPFGLDDENVVSAASRDRLIVHGMLERHETEEGPRTIITGLGIVTMRFNASCIDGSERLPRRLS